MPLIVRFNFLLRILSIIKSRLSFKFLGPFIEKHVFVVQMTMEYLLSWQHSISYFVWETTTLARCARYAIESLALTAITASLVMLVQPFLPIMSDPSLAGSFGGKWLAETPALRIEIYLLMIYLGCIVFGFLLDLLLRVATRDGSIRWQALPCLFIFYPAFLLAVMSFITIFIVLMTAISSLSSILVLVPYVGDSIAGIYKIGIRYLSLCIVVVSFSVAFFTWPVTVWAVISDNYNARAKFVLVGLVILGVGIAYIHDRITHCDFECQLDRFMNEHF